MIHIMRFGIVQEENNETKVKNIQFIRKIKSNKTRNRCICKKKKNPKNRISMNSFITHHNRRLLKSSNFSVLYKTVMVIPQMKRTKKIFTNWINICNRIVGAWNFILQHILRYKIAYKLYLKLSRSNLSHLYELWRKKNGFL